MGGGGRKREGLMSSSAAWQVQGQPGIHEEERKGRSKKGEGRKGGREGGRKEGRRRHGAYGFRVRGCFKIKDTAKNRDQASLYSITLVCVRLVQHPGTVDGSTGGGVGDREVAEEV